MNEIEQSLATIEPSQRVLLLSHCLRPSQTCPGKFDKKGMNCPADCRESCVLGRLKGSALGLGYRGVCIAAGGAMALRFVKEHKPRGIVAVACDKELKEGVSGVEEITKGNGEMPTIVIIPLTKDGCVDTEVDEEQALKTISLGLDGSKSWDMPRVNMARLC